MAVLVVGAWEVVPEIGLGKAWEKGAWGTTRETYFGSLHVLHPQRATGAFGSKVLSSPVPVPSPAVFASAAASPTSVILHGWPRSGTQPSSWSPWVSSRPPPPRTPCCPLGLRPGMVVTGVWPLLVLCLQERTCPSVRPTGTPGDLPSLGAGPCVLCGFCVVGRALPPLFPSDAGPGIRDARLPATPPPATGQWVRLLTRTRWFLWS